MKTFSVLALALPAMAAVTPLSTLVSRQVLSELTVSEAQNLCAEGQTISCCNSVKQGDTINESSGVLSGVLNGALSGGLSVNSECSKIDVAVRTYSPTPALSIHFTDIAQSSVSRTSSTTSAPARLPAARATSPRP